MDHPLAVDPKRRRLARPAGGNSGDEPDQVRLEGRRHVGWRRLGGVIGMGMVVADDAVGAAAQGSRQVEAQRGIDLEAASFATRRHVGTGPRPGDGDGAVGPPADQQAAALLRVGPFGGLGDGRERILADQDQGRLTIVPLTRPDEDSTTNTRSHGPGGPMRR